MTPEQRAELKRLAEAASGVHNALSPERLSLADAANPAAVLDLLAALEKAEHDTEERDSARALQADRAREAERERDALKAEVDRFRNVARAVVRAADSSDLRFTARWGARLAREVLGE